MKHLLHQSLDGSSGASLYIRIDFEDLVLDIEFQSQPGKDDAFPEELIGSSQYADKTALYRAYEKATDKLFGDLSEFNFIDDDSDVEVAVDLDRWQHLYCVGDPQHSSEEVLALSVLRDILLKWNGERLDNLVFYWGDESCNCVYINSSGLNDKSERALKKHISTSDGSWLDGELMSITIPGCDMLPMGEYSGELAHLQTAVNAVMYKLCAQLEARKLFGIFPHAESFRAFNVWHDEESEVDFRLRKSCREKCV